MIEDVVRGTLVTWTATFTDEDGLPVIPDSASVFVDYRTSETDTAARETVEIAMTEAGNTLIADWASNDAFGGVAYWCVRADNFAEQGTLNIRANLANPDP